MLCIDDSTMIQARNPELCKQKRLLHGLQLLSSKITGMLTNTILYQGKISYCFVLNLRIRLIESAPTSFT